MGCSGSKNMPAEPVAVDKAEPLVQALKPKGVETKKAEPPAKPEPEPEPEPEPPAAPVPCTTFRLDGSAMQCLDCASGWLSRVATDGKKPGARYFFSAGGVSQWQHPAGGAKDGAEDTCVCGCLKCAHIVCEEWNPQPGTEPATCLCGFTKDEHKPCNNYRVNMAAANFGGCKCGFSKEEHAASAFAVGAKAKRADRTSKELRDEMAQKEYADCAQYRVNLASPNFGECMCGRPKADHSPEALAKNAAAGQCAGTTRRDSGEMRTRFTRKQKVSCPKYEPDLTAGDFGVCKCGAKRADHTDMALAADTGAKAAKQQDEAEVRAGFVKRQMAVCTRFELNMEASVPFGTCMCGRPRAEHTDEALAADIAPKGHLRKTESTVRREMETKQDEIGTTVETHGAKTGVTYGLGNTVRTAADEEAVVQAAIKARAGGADKAAALNEFNEMMKECL